MTFAVGNLEPVGDELVAIVGGGRMGTGIAQVVLARGFAVVLVEADDAAMNQARERVRAGLERARERGQLEHEPVAYLSRLDLTTVVEAIPSDSALVIEAVPEDLKLKLDVLRDVEHTVGVETLLATNTSSLPITELGSTLDHPERFCGMHFFNPVPVLELVEVIVGTATSSDTRERACQWAKSLGKTPVTIQDSPGFATSRLGVALGLEAIRMLEDGVADAESIDTAMELGYRHPMGPLRSTDLIGLDVRMAVADHLSGTLGDRFTPPQLLRDKVARGELGRKTGQGFYPWTD